MTMRKLADKKKPGPKTLCTPEMVQALASEIERGASIEAACGAVGIGSAALRIWRAKSEDGVEPYAAILAPLKRALEVAVRHAEQRIFEGVLRWESSARWLESVRPDPWRRSERREVTQTTDIRVAWPDLAPETPDALARRCTSIDEALRKAGQN